MLCSLHVHTGCERTKAAERGEKKRKSKRKLEIFLIIIVIFL